MKKLFVLMIAGAMLIGGCGSYENEAYKTYEESAYDLGAVATEEAMSYDYEEIDPEFSQDAIGATSKEYGKKIVYTYTERVQTMDFDAMEEGVYKLVADNGGYIESSNTNNWDDSRVLDLTIRIKQEKVSDILGYTSTNGNVVNQNMYTEDKTAEYIDVDSRKISRQEEIKKLQELAKEAESVADLIEIESRISDLQYEIENYERQLLNIDDKVTYSTINLTIEEVSRYSYVKPGFVQRLSDKWDDVGYEVSEALISFITGIPMFFVGMVLFIIPAAIIILVGGFIIINLIRILKKITGVKKKEKPKE